MILWNLLWGKKKMDFYGNGDVILFLAFSEEGMESKKMELEVY